MSVYVDDMRAPLKRGFRTYIMCHMVADTEAELHRMADRIGVQRKWFQGDHYDISLTMRKLAVAAGACQITRREAVEIVKAQRRELRKARREEPSP